MTDPGRPPADDGDAAERLARAERFAEVVRYAQRVLAGGGHSRASQRELAEKLAVAPTMLTRYLAGNTDFMNLRAVTLQNLAQAAGLHLGTVMTWVTEGREAAMAYERQFSGTPVTFTALDLARQLVLMLEEEQQQPALARVDYEALEARIDLLRAAGPELFDRLAETLQADAAIARVRQREPLMSEDWAQLGRLLNVGGEDLEAQCTH